MATFTDIKEIRLRVNDPAGFQNLVEAATPSALPASPAPYTAYKVVSTGAYVSTEKTSGATSADYTTLDIYLSDARLSAWIDLDGVDRSECRAYEAITARIGSEMRLKRSSAGAESHEFQTLIELYNYYKALSDSCKERYRESTGNGTGRFGASIEPEIGGGEI